MSRSSELSRKVIVSQRMKRNCKENFSADQNEPPADHTNQQHVPHAASSGAAGGSQNLDQVRQKTPQSPLFATNPTRAVHHWQSNIDKEIESQQVSQERQLG